MASTAEKYSESEDVGVVSSTCRTSNRKILNVDLERRVPCNFPHLSWRQTLRLEGERSRSMGEGGRSWCEAV